jgi:hypothetical protein
MRSSARLWFVVALLLAGCGDEGGSGGRLVKPHGFEGRFTGEGRNGPVTFTLVRSGDAVEISSGDEKLVGRVVASDRVEAESREGNVRARMTLTLDGENLRMKVTATDDAGNTEEIPDVLLKRVGVPSPAAGGGAASGGTRDARLVAHWRSTETRASAELSYAKDTHLVLNADGTFETWDKTVSSLSGTEESAHTRGTWKTEGGRLWIKPDERPEWFSAGKFGLTDTHLMLTDARGEKTIYERR